MEILTYVSSMEGLCKGIPTPLDSLLRYSNFKLGTWILLWREMELYEGWMFSMDDVDEKYPQTKGWTCFFLVGVKPNFMEMEGW